MGWGGAVHSEDAQTRRGRVESSRWLREYTKRKMGFMARVPVRKHGSLPVGASDQSSPVFDLSDRRLRNRRHEILAPPSRNNRAMGGAKRLHGYNREGA